MSGRSDVAFRNWLAQVVNGFRPHSDPSTAEALWVAADRLFEMGELFASLVIRSLGESQFTKGTVKVRRLKPLFLDVGGEEAPLVELVAARGNALEQSHTVSNTIRAAESPAALLINEYWHDLHGRAPESWYPDFSLFPKLESLTMTTTNCQMPIWVKRRLLGASQLRNLSRLDLSFGGFGLEGIRFLLGTEVMKRLTTINLTANGLGNPGFIALAESSTPQCLKALDVSHNGLTSTSIESIIRSPALSSLNQLALRCNGVGTRGAELLGQLACREHLEALDLAGCRIPAKGIMALVRSGPWPRLRDLGLRDHGIGDRATKALAVSEAFPSLQRIDLRGHDIRPDALRVLRRSEAMRGVEVVTR